MLGPEGLTPQDGDAGLETSGVEHRLVPRSSRSQSDQRKGQLPGRIAAHEVASRIMRAVPTASRHTIPS
jgi:hypothetical protein